MTKEDLIERVLNDFKYHPPKSEEEIKLYTETRDKYLKLALWLIETRSLSSDLYMSITHLEDSMFRANAAIARS